MILRHAGEARLTGRDPDDVLLMCVGDDLLSVRLDLLRQFVYRKRSSAPICRRYPGTVGRFLDVQISSEIRRTRRGRGLTFWFGGRYYVVPTEDVIDVINSQERYSTVEIYEIVTDAAHLSDATSRQTALEEV